MSDYLNQDKFEERPSSLVFNGGDAGVVRGCQVKVSKKAAGDPENLPEYKLEVLDTAQQTNNDDSITVYPVNKGFFYQESFKSERAEQYAVNELKHLLKTFGHKTEKNDKGIDIIVPERPITSYNDFMDYTFEFINKSLKENPNLYDVVVDYGNGDYPKSFLQLNGYPWYIGIAGANISNKRDAIMERPERESESDNSNPYKDTEKKTTNWV